MQWDLRAGNATTYSIRVGPWNVIAVTSLPSGPHAQTPAATNQYRSLDVQARLLESFANMQGP